MYMITLNECIAKYGTEKINTMTKYPSIMTYHDLGERGCLLPSLVENRPFFDRNPCYVTEKIDGTNSRIIIWGDDYLIGSREQLLYAKGDRFGDPAQNIVNTVKGCAEGLELSDRIYILYGETYGGNVTAASKQYTSDKTYDFRLFDIAIIAFDQIEGILTDPIDKISSWREHGGQKFFTVDELEIFAKAHNLQTVPYLAKIDGDTLPLTLSEVYDWLQQFASTKAGINHSGKAEGVVVRTSDRSLIRKIRFEDYEKTKKRGGF